MSLRISDLYLYPLKSAAGIRVDALELDAFGAVGDRRWMLVDADGRFLSQRVLPPLARLRATLSGPRPDEARLVVEAMDRPDLPPLVVAPPDPAAPRRSVLIWDDRCEAAAAPETTRSWLREAIGLDCALVYAPSDMERLVDPDYASGDERVGFSDGFPLLLIGQPSLDDLNARLLAREQPALPMNRFRPNIVVEGAGPYEEDAWQRLAVESPGAPGVPVHLDVVKPCARCAITTVDQDTGVAGKEPLRTFATYRRQNGKVYFGQNVIHRGTGTLRVGDAVQVVARR